MKHAYLIMAHHRFDVLQEIIFALDDIDNDLYIHIDKKIKNIPILHASKSKIIFIKRINVNWGGYSQIQCTLNLLKAAYSSNNKYLYYHFITGTTYPIKPLKYISNFFEKNFPKQFIGFDKANENSNNVSNRIRYFWIFNELGKRRDDLIWRFKNIIKKILVKTQKLLNYDRFKKYKLIIKKGTAYFSITHSFAEYVLKNEKQIKKMYRHSQAADEVFMQTLIYNSSFKKDIYNLDDEYKGAMCVSCWEKVTNGILRENNSFILEDLKLLLKRQELFALKFEGNDAIKLINLIKHSFKN